MAFPHPGCWKPASNIGGVELVSSMHFVEPSDLLDPSRIADGLWSTWPKHIHHDKLIESFRELQSRIFEYVSRLVMKLTKKAERGGDGRT